MSIVGGATVYWTEQVKTFNDTFWCQVDVVLNPFGYVSALLGMGSFYIKAHGLRQANGITYLYIGPGRLSTGHNVLGNPACQICGTTIYLSRILTGKSTTSMRTIAAVSINNNLTTGKTGIAIRSANNKPASRINKKFSIIVYVLLG